MSVTGVLLMYEKQMTAWADRGYRVAPPSSGATRLPVETLLGKVREQRSALPSTFTLRSDPSAPAALGFGRESIVYINPYTGEILGEGAKGIRTFFRVVTDWHRWLGAQGENRSIARAVTGACNLGFLFLVVSGFYIWWPKQWTWSQLRNVTWFRRGLARQGARFQLAQCHWVLVGDTPLHRRALGHGDLVSLGKQPGLPFGWRRTSGARWRKAQSLDRVSRSAANGNASKEQCVSPKGSEAQRGPEARRNRQAARLGSRRETPGEIGRWGLTAAPPTDLNLEGFDDALVPCGATACRLAEHQLAASFLSKCATGIHDRPRQRRSAPKAGPAHVEPGNWRSCALGAVLQHDAGPKAPDGVAVSLIPARWRASLARRLPELCQQVHRCLSIPVLLSHGAAFAPGRHGGSRRNRSRQLMTDRATRPRSTAPLSSYQEGPQGI